MILNRIPALRTTSTIVIRRRGVCVIEICRQGNFGKSPEMTIAQFNTVSVVSRVGVGSQRRYQIRNVATNPAPNKRRQRLWNRNKRISTVSCNINIKCPESVFGPGLIAAVSVSGVFLIFLVVAAVIFFKLRRIIGKKKSEINEQPVSPNVSDVTWPETAESSAEHLYEITSSRSPEHLYDMPETQMMLPVMAHT
ncbi:uncharacterized protein LOC121373132 [Gigantopelta aegis]|uniref:uncharacterized protein LOC121373132 n=1 Tax=Gigantopelta aegis TaxID=1735272 RepID=UPI001B8877D1|nr:uncharacterized protein LOC121373132 [Gigantopelta aegis]